MQVMDVQTVYVNHCNYIYIVGHHFYNVNRPKAVKATRKFYIRNKLAERDENDILDIEVSLDGAFSSPGQESTYCITMVMDVWTHRCINHEVSVKCFFCPNSEDITSNGKCKYKLFHGPTGTLEKENYFKTLQKICSKVESKIPYLCC